MCGHAGYAFSDPSRAADASVLSRMGQTISHRGPDDEGIWTRPGSPVGAVFRRLSIIDLEGGHQPIPNEDGDVVVLVNGEIYNFQTLRVDLEKRGHVFRTHSDAEVVVHLYEECGADLAKELIGMFAFAIIDLRGAAPRVVIGRDRLGIKPMYFLSGADGFAWASEPKALLALAGDGPTDRAGSAPGDSRLMRKEALLDYLMRGFIGGEESAWSGISRLRPGCTLTWEASQTNGPLVDRYWDLPLELRGEASESEVIEWTDRVVSDRLVADVPLGAFLSGGIDSSAVVTSMARRMDEPVVACSVGFEEKSHDELEIAVATAKSLGAIHHTEVLRDDPRLALDVLPWFYDEPLADPSTVPTYLVSKMAREHVTVALSGDGGDETFGGYRRYVHDVAENKLRRAIGAPGRAVAGLLGNLWPRMESGPRFLRGKTFLTNVAADPAEAYFNSVSILSREEALDLLAPALRRELWDHSPFHEFEKHYRKVEADCPLYRAQYADFHTYLTDQILAKVDRASMAVSLEVRVPLLDHRFVERFANLPAHQKVRGGRGKHIFREALRPRLSAEVLDGVKRGFDTPLDSWIRKSLRTEVHSAVKDLPSDWFDKLKLQRLLDEHDAGVRNHGRILWSLFVLERWRKRHGVRGISA